MDKTRESNTANVSFVVGKCGKSLQGVDSFIFDPKDMDRTRFSCKTRGCNASIAITENGSGERVVRVKGKHNHPNHAQAIQNINHIQRIREEVKDVRNKYV